MNKIQSILLPVLLFLCAQAPLHGFINNTKTAFFVDIIKNIDFKDTKKVLQSFANLCLIEFDAVKEFPLDESWKLKRAQIEHKEFVDTGIEVFKKLPVELKKITYKAAQATKIEIKRIKAEMQNNMKSYKSVIAQHEKMVKSLELLNKKANKSQKDNAAINNLNNAINNNKNAYAGAIKDLENLEKDFNNAQLDELEQWANYITRIAYWNSGAGFFEQFGLLNWSGKMLTIFGTPLACYGAYKIYTDYYAAEDQDSEAKIV